MSEKNKEYRYTPEIRGYMNAVWHYFMEHCDITENGNFFIKFHCDNQRSFENHVTGRWKYNYHRDDPVKVYDKGKELQQKHLQEKEVKKQKWKELKASKQEGWRKQLRSYLIRLINKYI